MTASSSLPCPASQVETAGDCYIVAGALMELDDEGFMTLDAESDAAEGAQNVLSFAQVGGGFPVRVGLLDAYFPRREGRLGFGWGTWLCDLVDVCVARWDDSWEGGSNLE